MTLALIGPLPRFLLAQCQQQGQPAVASTAAQRLHGNFLASAPVWPIHAIPMTDHLAPKSPHPDPPTCNLSPKWTHKHPSKPYPKPRRPTNYHKHRRRNHQFRSINGLARAFLAIYLTFYFYRSQQSCTVHLCITVINIQSTYNVHTEL